MSKNYIICVAIAIAFLFVANVRADVTVGTLDLNKVEMLYSFTIESKDGKLVFGGDDADKITRTANDIDTHDGVPLGAVYTHSSLTLSLLASESVSAFALFWDNNYGVEVNPTKFGTYSFMSHLQVNGDYLHGEGVGFNQVDDRDLGYLKDNGNYYELGWTEYDRLVFSFFDFHITDPDFGLGDDGVYTFAVYGTHSAVPEPTTFAILGLGLVAGFGFARRRK